MRILLAILAIVLTIVLVIGIHELGHFLCARLMGVKVLVFSLGFGKPLWHFTSKRGTRYQIALIPLGGFVKLLDEREAPVPPELLPLSFTRQAIWKRGLIVSAGPFINIVFALCAFWWMFMIGVADVKPMIEKVLPNSPFFAAGITAPQQIVAIDGVETRNWRAVVLQLLFRVGEPEGTMTVTTCRDETGCSKDALQCVSENTKSCVFAYKIPLKNWHLDPIKPNLLASLGIVPNVNELKNKVIPMHQYSVGEAFIKAVNQFSLLVKLNFVLFYKLIMGQISIYGLAGPISLFSGAILTLQQGISQFLGFLATLSMAVAIVNIFPIPGLDGGHMLYLLIEKWRGKPVSIAAQVLAYQLSLILFVMLFIQVMLNDLLRILPS